MVAAVGHRQPADEVGQPDVGRPLLLRVLVQVVVELPGLVADPEVVLLLADEVVEDHEVGEQDLVHAPDRLEAVQIVLGRLALDVARLVCKEAAGRMDSLAARLEHRRDGVLSEPVDLEVRMELSQLVGDRRVTLRVAEPDRRRDEQRTLAARPAANPALRRRRRLDEVAQEQVDLDRVACVGKVSRPLEERERTVRELGQTRARLPRPHGVVRAVDDEHRAVDAGDELPHALLVGEPRRQLRRDQRLGVRVEAPPDRVLALFRRVRLRQALREEELEEVLVVLEPVVAVPLLPPCRVLVWLEEVLGRPRARHNRRQGQSRRDEHHLRRPSPGGSRRAAANAPRLAKARPARPARCRWRPSPRARRRRTPPRGRPPARAAGRTSHCRARRT